MSERHPSTGTWTLPPPERPPPPAGLRRTNLLALAARPGRFEHHLMVVARVGDAQLEIATASEPLYFGHQNLSDEYVLALATGDALLDSMPFRVFLSEPDSGRDVGRIVHRVGDLVLHPEGWLHWPGRLRPPFEAPAFPDGHRRAVLSLVFCASQPTASSMTPGVHVPEARSADVKAYPEPAVAPHATPPLYLADLGRTEPGVLARIGDVTLSLVDGALTLPRGGYVAILDPGGETLAGDLVYVPAGARADLEPDQRALAMTSDVHDAAPPPALWERVAEAPFARFEDAAALALPFRHDALSVDAASDVEVTVGVGDAPTTRVPRYWMARTLYRIALHAFVEDTVRTALPRPCLGYVETYGGFFYDDRGAYRLGTRAGGSVEIEPSRLSDTLEALYRAVAPPGYVEDLR